MSVSEDSLLCKIGRLGLLAQAAAISGMVLVLWLVLAPLAYRISGQFGPLAAASGAGACWLGAMLALPLAAVFRGPAAAMYAMVLGMLVRATIPLLLIVAFRFKMPSLWEAGAVFYLLIFYLVTMALETALLLAQVRPRQISKDTL